MSTYRISVSEGYLYPSNKEEMDKIMDNYNYRFTEKFENKEIIGVLVPHGKIQNCGELVMSGLKSLEFSHKSNFLILGTKHNSSFPINSYYDGSPFQAHGRPFPIYSRGIEIIKNNPWIQRDNLSHEKEYSIDSILPYLSRVRRDDIGILPILLGRHNIDDSLNIARTFNAIKNESIMIVSANLNQYENKKNTEEKDKILLDAFTSLDVERFHVVAKEINHTGCNLGGMGALMEATRVARGSIMIIQQSIKCYNSYGNERCTGYSAIVSYREL